MNSSVFRIIQNIKNGGLSLIISLIAILATGHSARASGELWDIQFAGNFNGATAQTGAAVIGNSGDSWNLLTASSGSDVSLINSVGASSPVTFSYTSQGAATAPNSPGSYGFYGTSDADLMQGYLFAFSAADRTMSFSDLVPDSSYTLFIYTQGDSASNGREISVTSGSNTYQTTPTDASASTFILNQNYMTFSATSNSSGTLTFTYNIAANEADINGIQIVGPAVVPEPSTYALIGAGLALFLFLRRRKLA